MRLDSSGDFTAVGNVDAASFTENDSSTLSNGISGSADKVDNNHVTARSIWTGVGETDYLVNTSWVKIYGYATLNALRIENPAASGENIRYWYSKNLAAPVENTLAAGATVDITDLGTGSIDIRVGRFSDTTDSHQVTFWGIGMGSGYIRGHVIYDE